MVKNKTILLVEDQKDLWIMVEHSFRDLPFEILTAIDKEQALFYLMEQQVDLVLLDIMLDEDNGLEILSFIRKQNQLTPIIMLSSLGDMATRRKSFELGADDYLIKPYAPEELMMRVKRALERTENNQPQEELKNAITLGPIQLNMAEQSLIINEKPVILRSKLYNMMLLFMQNPNSVIRKEMFHNLIWKNELYDENSLTVHMHQLRKAISGVDNPKIVTVPKLGYRLEYKGE